jgi:hypothetical protein
MSSIGNFGLDIQDGKLCFLARLPLGAGQDVDACS